MVKRLCLDWRSERFTGEGGFLIRLYTWVESGHMELRNAGIEGKNITSKGTGDFRKSARIFVSMGTV